MVDKAALCQSLGASILPFPVLEYPWLSIGPQFAFRAVHGLSSGSKGSEEAMSWQVRAQLKERERSLKAWLGVSTKAGGS